MLEEKGGSVETGTWRAYFIVIDLEGFTMQKSLFCYFRVLWASGFPLGGRTVASLSDSFSKMFANFPSRE